MEEVYSLGAIVKGYNTNRIIASELWGTAVVPLYQKLYSSRSTDSVSENQPVSAVHAGGERPRCKTNDAADLRSGNPASCCTVLLASYIKRRGIEETIRSSNIAMTWRVKVLKCTTAQHDDMAACCVLFYGFKAGYRRESKGDDIL